MLEQILNITWFELFWFSLKFVSTFKLAEIIFVLAISLPLSFFQKEEKQK